MKQQITQNHELKQSDFFAEFAGFSEFLRRELAAKKDKQDSADCYHAILLESTDSLYNKLRKYNRFDEAVHIAHRCLAAENELFSYQKLIATGFLKIGLLTLYHDNHMPLHDHPGAYGSQYVLSGRVQLRQYQHISDMQTEQSIARLDKVTEAILVEDNVSVFEPYAGNIHQLNSISQRSVLLSMMIHPYKYQQRSWYFPMNDLIGTQEILFNRVTKRGQANNEN